MSRQYTEQEKQAFKDADQLDQTRLILDNSPEGQANAQLLVAFFEANPTIPVNADQINKAVEFLTKRLHFRSVDQQEWRTNVGPYVSNQDIDLLARMASDLRT